MAVERADAQGQALLLVTGISTLHASCVVHARSPEHEGKGVMVDRERDPTSAWRARKKRALCAGLSMAAFTALTTCLMHDALANHKRCSAICSTQTKP